MDSAIKFVEPLFEKIRELTIAGQGDVLKKSLSLYGTDDDIGSLVALIRANPLKESALVIDFTPFLTLGTQTRLHRLVALAEEIPFVVLVKKGIILEHLRTLIPYCNQDDSTV